MIIVVPVAAQPVPSGPPATLPLDLLDSPPEAMSGSLSSDTVVAQYKVRVSDAIVLTSPVHQGLVDLPTGTVLAKVIEKPSRQFADGPRTLWCDTRPTGIFHFGDVACLEDTKGSGVLDVLTGVTPTSPYSSLSVVSIRLGAGGAIEPPTYRPAAPQERPETKIGYRFCAKDSDGRNIPYRFTSVIFQANHGWIGPTLDCPFGEWPNTADKNLLAADRIKLRITASGSTANFEVIEGIDPGRLDGVSFGGSFRSIDAPDPAKVKQADARAAHAFVPTGLAEGFMSGERMRNDVITMVPVEHGVTGVLKNDVVAKGLFGAKRLTAGQYVYGIPMRNRIGDEQITWCAPQPLQGTPGAYTTVCFMPFGDGYLWVDAFSALMPLSLMANNASLPAVGLSVDRKPASLGAEMKLTYVFNHWESYRVGSARKLAANIRVEIRVNDHASPISELDVLAGPDGIFRFGVENGLTTLTPLDAKDQPLRVFPTDGSPAEINSFLATIDKDKAQLIVTASNRLDGLLQLGGSMMLTIVPPPMAGGGAATVPTDRKPSL